jgi:hypothetical protein
MDIAMTFYAHDIKNLQCNHTKQQIENFTEIGTRNSLLGINPRRNFMDFEESNKTPIE